MPSPMLDVDSFIAVMGEEMYMRLAWDIHRGWQARMHMARVRQRRIKIATESLERCANKELDMTMDMRVDKEIWHYWGRRLGYECWEDPEFCREFKRDNEDVRVTTAKNMATVGWTRARELERKFKHKYRGAAPQRMENGKMDNGTRKKSPSSILNSPLSAPKVLLTDRRGNAE